VRWIGVLVGLTLLCAGATPKRADRDHRATNDEIAAVTALAKLVARRHEGTRPIGSLGLDPIALVSSEPHPEPPQLGIELVHAAPARFSIVAHDSYDARGPPLG